MSLSRRRPMVVSLLVPMVLAFAFPCSAWQRSPFMSRVLSILGNEPGHGSTCLFVFPGTYIVSHNRRIPVETRRRRSTSSSISSQDARGRIHHCHHRSVIPAASSSSCCSGKGAMDAASLRRRGEDLREELTAIRGSSTPPGISWKEVETSILSKTAAGTGFENVPELQVKGSRVADLAGGRPAPAWPWGRQRRPAVQEPRVALRSAVRG
jgi:hypothetical protein